MSAVKIIIALVILTAIGVGIYFAVKKLKGGSSGSSEETKGKGILKKISEKIPIPTPSKCPAFVAYTGSEIAGFDFKKLTDKTEDDCKNECIVAGCHWYNYNSKDKTCELKKAKETKDIITAFRLDKSPEICSQYAVYADTNVSGFDMKDMPLKNKTQDECQADCATNECHWYNYDSGKKECWLKKASAKTDWVTGVPVPVKKPSLKSLPKLSEAIASKK